MEFLEQKKIYYSSTSHQHPPAGNIWLWLVGNQLPHLQTTDQKNRENPTTGGVVVATVKPLLLSLSSRSFLRSHAHHSLARIEYYDHSFLEEVLAVLVPPPQEAVLNMVIVQNFRSLLKSKF